LGQKSAFLASGKGKNEINEPKAATTMSHQFNLPVENGSGDPRKLSWKK